jgi:hypothetical protein
MSCFNVLVMLADISLLSSDSMSSKVGSYNARSSEYWSELKLGEVGSLGQYNSPYD